MSKKRQVNWIDSMELRADHFLQSENFFLSAIADTAAQGLTNYNYGLLPVRSGSDAYNGIRVSEHVTGHIEVQLYSCDAVTASGFRISFSADESGSALIKNYSPSEDSNLRNRDVKHWDIILAVDPFSRAPLGEPDPQETPPRQPDSESSYGLYVMPAGDINTMDFGRHHLTIGRLRKDGERYVVDTNYIPPSTSMASHPELADYYNNFGALLNSIEKSSKAIVEKIHDRSNKSDLAHNTHLMSSDILRYIASMYFDFRNKGRYAAPIDIVGYVSSLAHTCYASLTTIHGRHKEEMLKYFYEWTDISPGSFEELLANTLDMIYEHDNIRAIMVRSEHFLRTFEELWERLSRLEFIGQHKESVVVSERSQESDPTTTGTKRRWSVTD